MLTAHALALAKRHRRRIDVHMGRAVVLLRMDPEAARRPLALARWRLLQLLHEYHLFKQNEIFDPAVRSGSSQQARQAEQMFKARREGWEGFRAYTFEWSSRDLVGAWDSYTDAMTSMANRLHDHVAREEMLIAELLHGSTRTRHLVH